MVKRNIFFIALALIFFPIAAFALISMQLEWGITESLESGYHLTDDGAIVDSYLYIVGQAQTDGASTWRIEKRNISDGSLVYATTSNPSSGSDEAHHIAVDSTYMYVTGNDNDPGNQQWRLEKRALSDGSLIYATSSNPSGSTDIPYDTDLDSTHLYISGSDFSAGNYAWRIEKRLLSDGSLVYATTSNPTGGTDRPFGLSIDSSYMYVTGNSGSNWLIEKRALSDGSLVYATTTSGFSGVAYGLTIDSSYMYVVGYAGSAWRIEKRSLSDGSLAYATSGTPSGTSGARLFAVQKDEERLYVGGYAIVGSDYYWYIARHNISDGSFIDYAISSSSPSECWTSIYALALHDNVVYPFGEINDDSCSTALWRVEAYDIAPAPTVSSFSPSSDTIKAGSEAQTLTINGTNFSASTTALTWKGSAKTATFVSSTQMTVNFSTSDLETGGRFTLTIPNDYSIADDESFTYEIAQEETSSGSGGGSGSRSKKIVIEESETPADISNVRLFVFLKDLKYLQVDPDVQELQKFLNTHGFPVSASGPGSAGNETDFFGALTKAALTRFQEANADAILKPNSLTKGTGYFGPSTRAFVNSKL